MIVSHVTSPITLSKKHLDLGVYFSAYCTTSDNIFKFSEAVKKLNFVEQH